MSLLREPLPPGDGPLPADVRRLLREADRRIVGSRFSLRAPAFVASDFARVYAALRGLAESDLPTGRWFCEWGSGLGVVACLAALLGFDAWGIEVEHELVEAARQLAEDFDLPVEFVQGSFLPAGEEPSAAEGPGLSWLSTEEPSAYAELGFDPDDFDVIYAYPWPGEEGLTERLFERYAREGALLLTFHGGDDLRLHRKVRRPGRGRSRL